MVEARFLALDSNNGLPIIYLKPVFFFTFLVLFLNKQVSPWPACLYTNISFARANRVSSTILYLGMGVGIQGQEVWKLATPIFLQYNMRYMYYVVSQ